MRILVLHRVPDPLVRYSESIDHSQHDVTYVGTADRLVTLPASLPARLVERPGTGDTATEVLAAVAGRPAPDLVVALSEYDLIAAAEVRAALGVPGDRVADVLPVRDKVTMKATVAAADLRVPRFASLASVLTDGADAVGWTGQTILKPRTGASSEGVRTFPTVAAALVAARESGSPDEVDGFEIEEFVDGPILHIDGMMADGAPVAVLASRYVGTCLGYAQGQPLGSVQIDTEPAVVAWALRCLAAVGIRTGPFHLEAIETPDGLVFLEVGARFGGADVVDTFELATGLRLPSAQLTLLVDGPGARLTARVPGPDERFGWFVWPGHTLGSTHCQIRGEESFRRDPVVWRWVQRAPDEPVKPSITYADVDVPLAGVLGPASAPALEQFLAELFAKVQVEPADPAGSPWSG